MSFPEWIVAHQIGLSVSFFYGLLLILGIWESGNPLSGLPPHRKKRWFTNFGISFIGGITLAVIPITGLTVSIWAGQKGFGLLNWIVVPALASFILTVLTRSFASWALHLSMHKVHFLWRIHRIHHLDGTMDVSTTVRFHPFEFFFSFATGILVIALLGLPAWALVAYEIMESAVRFFSHANIHLPQGLERALRLVISTPAFHRIHHSINRKETDSNYGAILSIWDRFFGTYHSPDGKDLSGMTLGLEGTDPSKEQSFWWLLGNPFLKR